MKRTLTGTALKAKQTRDEYKRRGWTARDISVRTSLFAGGSSISVEIKNPSIPLDVATEIANENESIRRCEFSGDILSGGNTYVSVGYSWACEQKMAERWVGRVEDAMIAHAELGDEGRTRLLRITDHCMIGRASNGFGFQIWSTPHPDQPGRAGMHFSEAQAGAFEVAMAEQRANAAA